MRSFRTLSTLAVLSAALLLVRGTAAADPCAGSHYEYDHGECYDKAGSTVDDMLHMYSEGDKLQAGMIDRSRSASGAGARAAPRLPESARATMQAIGVAAVRAMSFTPQATSPAIADFVNFMPQHDRPHARKLFGTLLHDYRETTDKEGYSPYVASTGPFFALVAAYRVFGDGWSAPTLAQQTWMGMTINLARLPGIATLSDTDLQHLSDHFALAGGALFYAAREAALEGDRKALARVRTAARSFLITKFKVDPLRSPLDDSYCSANAAMLTASCDTMKFIMTQGRAGHNPFKLPPVP